MLIAKFMPLVFRFNDNVSNIVQFFIHFPLLSVPDILSITFLMMKAESPFSHLGSVVFPIIKYLLPGELEFILRLVYLL